MSDRKAPLVRILMGTYNGAAFLDSQLESIARQTFKDWHLFCSDDGSTDDTLAVLNRFAEAHPGQVTVVPGPCKGFSENFLSLVRTLPDDCGYVGFADQDDIWFPDKIERALTALKEIDETLPALYGSASWIWNDRTDSRRKTPNLRKPPSFLNALVENFATGNTFLLNQPAARLLRDASQQIGPVFAHDWWSYALISGAGGTIIYDDTPTLLYRQHGSNEIGAGETFLKRQLRNLSVADGRYKRKVGINLRALKECERLLTREKYAQFAQFVTARSENSPLNRVFGVLRSGVYRQSIRDQSGLVAASFVNRI